VSDLTNKGYPEVATQEELMFNRLYCQPHVFAFLLTLLLHIAAAPTTASAVDPDSNFRAAQPTPAVSCDVLDLPSGTVLAALPAVGKAVPLRWDVGVWALDGSASALVVPGDQRGSRWWISVATGGRYVVCFRPLGGAQGVVDPEEEEPDPDPTGQP